MQGDLPKMLPRMRSGGFVKHWCAMVCDLNYWRMCKYITDFRIVIPHQLQPISSRIKRLTTGLPFSSLPTQITSRPRLHWQYQIRSPRGNNPELPPAL